MVRQHVRSRTQVSLRRQRGFSLYELIITLCLATGTGVGAASMYALVQRQTQSAEINQLISEFSLARSDAIKRNAKVVACASVTGRRCDAATDYTWWHRGMLIFIDTDNDDHVDPGEPVLRMRSSDTNRVRIKSSRFRSQVVFQPTGMTAGSTITLTFCPEGQNPIPRYIIVSNTGRARVSSKPPDGRIDEPLERCS